MSLRFDRYLDPEEVSAALAEMCAAYPGHARLGSLGTSYEGRNLPLLVLTNTATGPDTDKPALWVSGNIHAIEVTGAMAALHVADTVLREHIGLLDSITIYVAPCLAPDGAHRVFHQPGELVLSGTRVYPAPLADTGLRTGDVDGDGRVLSMRVRDPNGPFKVSDVDSRLMVRREPDDEDGDYYLLLPEGRVPSYDGHTIVLAPSAHGLNFNRNFPADWGPESEESGAGPFPLSEPETRAVADFVASHPNICAAMDYHTYSGIHLRPFGGRDDATMPMDDLRVFEAMGRKASAYTGYPAVSVWHGFRYHPTKGMRGSLLDWFYLHHGIYSWTTELWDLCREAGVVRTDFVRWHEDHPVEDELAMLQWSDKVLDGRGYVDWYPVEHPELGSVELGGWDRLFLWNNPPPELLEAELSRNTPFTLFLARLLPRLEWRAVTALRLGQDQWLVEAVIDNGGYLPSYGSDQAAAVGQAGSVVVTLAGAEVIDGPAERDLGRLAGRAGGERFAGITPVSPTTFRARTTWHVHAAESDVLELEVAGARCGRLRTTIQLSGDASPAR